MSDLPAKVEPVVLDAYIVDPPRAAADMTDRELGDEAAKAVDRAIAMRADSAESALRAGELLLEANHRCQQSGVSFKQWLLRHWPKGRTTALAYMKIATEVQGDLGRRADLLACNSIRQFLTDRGYGAGGTRDKSDPDEMRGPGADEDEDANVPDPANMNAPTPAEAAVVGRIATDAANEKQAAKDAARAKRNKHRDERDNPPAPQPTEAEKAAEAERRRLAAEKVAEERAALERAFLKPNGMEFPTPPIDPNAPPPDALVSVEVKVKAVAEMLHDIARRIGFVSLELAAIKHAPIEGLDFLATGKDDPRRVEFDAIVAGLRPLFDGVGAIETYAPKLGAHGDYDARVVLAEQRRLAAQEQDDRAAVDMFSRKRGA